MANGKGRLIYENGDFYEGELQNDKAINLGIYINDNGSKYIGEWFDDK
jgi:hypothetical protein